MWEDNIKVGCAYSKSECWGTEDIQGAYLYVCAYNNGEWACVKELAR